MRSYAELLDSFTQYLREKPFSREPFGLYDPIDYIMQLGGKRLRPVLVLMAQQLYAEDCRGALPAALAVEVFHNFSLVHDDIMDEAPLRRGKPAVHAKYGLNTGILSGDVMLIYVYKLLMELEEEALIPELIRLFNEVAIRVCEGQQYDVDFETRSDVTIPEYIRMIEYKTAVLMAGGLEIGARIGGASPEEAKKLYEFGRLAGIAFQLQDDLLDTYGDPAKFGKKVGGDIVQNKKTWLVIRALELAGPVEKKRLNELLSSTPEDEQQKIREVKAMFDQLGLREKARQEMENYLQMGFEALEGLAVDEEKKAPLRAIAESLIVREN
jgi:geranylgeranyl diphosphate synthase type II